MLLCAGTQADTALSNRYKHKTPGSGYRDALRHKHRGMGFIVASPGCVSDVEEVL